MLTYQLADRWGEPDPRKIAALPEQILMYWRAYFNLQGITAQTEPAPSISPETKSLTSVSPDVEAQCAAVIRVLMR